TAHQMLSSLIFDATPIPRAATLSLHDALPICAGSENRTRTGSPLPDFESGASTNFTIPAGKRGENIVDQGPGQKARTGHSGVSRASLRLRRTIEHPVTRPPRPTVRTPGGWSRTGWRGKSGRPASPVSPGEPPGTNTPAGRAGAS